MQPASSDLAEIFSPAPGVSVLAQILAIGISVLLALIWAFRFKYDGASRFIANDRCTLGIMTSDRKVVLSAKPFSPYYSGSHIEEMSRICS